METKGGESSFIFFSKVPFLLLPLPTSTPWQFPQTFLVLKKLASLGEP